MPTVAPAEQGSEPKPATASSTPTPTEAPVRVAQVMPTVAANPAPAEAKQGGKGLWVSVGAAALVLIGGAAALVLPSKKESAPPATVTELAPTVTVPERTPGKASETQVAAAPPSPGPTAPAATTPPSESAPSQTGAPGQTPAGQVPATASTTPPAAPVVEARGTLTVKAAPYADVYLDGKLIKSELQRPMELQLAPGTYKLTFKHPKQTESHTVTIVPNGRVLKSFVVPRK